MALSDEVVKDVSNIISTKWEVREGVTVPSTDLIKLSGGAVELDATFLYADLANSSKLAKELDHRVAAKILKSFLATTTRLIRSFGATIISFDGDRVLGVFVGDSKNSNAAKCGLQINWTVSEVIRVKFESQYDSVKNLNFSIAHGVGIDSGKILIVRAGARGNNDMISIGQAPSLAARLSEIREKYYRTYISANVYNRLNEASKIGGKSNTNMWKNRSLHFLNENLSIYSSGWQWAP